MATLARLTAAFRPVGATKLSTFGLDVRRVDAITGIGVNWDNGTLDDLVQAAYDGWSGSPNLRASFASDMQLVHADAFAYDIVVNPQAPPPQKRVPALGPRMSAGAPVSGTAAGSSLPPNNAIVCTYYTAELTRSGRGRSYLPGLPEGDVDGNGVVGSVALGNLQSRFEDWVIGTLNAAPTGTNFLHVVLSLHGTGSSERFEEVTVRQVKNRIDTQQRRLQREAS